jgi:hypothetical protein
MSQQEPNTRGPRFSPGRVLSVLSHVALAAGVFAAVWLIPWPIKPTPKPTATGMTPERIRELKRKAGKAVRELERDGGDGQK